MTTKCPFDPRWLWARFLLGQQLDGFIRGHAEAFAAFEGAPRPRVVLYENLKSVVLKRSGVLRSLAGRPCWSSRNVDAFTPRGYLHLSSLARICNVGFRYGLDVI